MKRFTVRTVLIAIVLIGLMAGAAFAIGSQLGILNFLEQAAPISGDAQQHIQTEFEQEGGELTDVTVRVRDAVSDGKTLFIAVEYKAKDPTHAVLLTGDNIDWTDTDLVSYWMQNRPPASIPDWESIRPDQAIHYVESPFDTTILEGDDGSPLPPVSGVSWLYDGTDTVVFNLMIDLGRLENPKDQLLLRLTPAVCKQLEAEAGIIERNPLYTRWDALESTEMTVWVKAGTMPVQKAMPETPFIFGWMQVDMMEVAVTPLAMYVTMNHTNIGDGNAGYWCQLYNGDGTPLEVMAMEQAPLLDGDGNLLDPDAPREMVYVSPGDMPESLLYRAVEAFMPELRGDEPLPEDMVIPLIPSP